MAPKKDKAPAPPPANSGGGKQHGIYKFFFARTKSKLITPSVLSERLRVNGSLARRAVKGLMAKGLIRMVSAHSRHHFHKINDHLEEHQEFVSWELLLIQFEDEKTKKKKLY
ncbi:hypothetical protein MKW92_018664 [Papaver armeniacum]|nr:hypothetical protein MKW92_018664 [Papaver armeniacum]